LILPEHIRVLITSMGREMLITSYNNSMGWNNSEVKGVRGLVKESVILMRDLILGHNIV
jgi:hypothetical protein